jgi:hypothetical protein
VTLQVGDGIPIRYDPADPQQAEVDPAIVWLLPGAVTLLCSAILMTSGVVMFLRN